MKHLDIIIVIQHIMIYPKQQIHIIRGITIIIMIIIQAPSLYTITVIIFLEKDIATLSLYLRMCL